MSEVDLNPNSPEYGTVKLSPDPDNPNNFTLISPPVDIRDSVLGRLMGKWSIVEGVVDVILARVLRADFETARIVAASGLTTIQTQDLILALARIRLPMQTQTKLEKLGGRLKNLNTKRNRVVHGQWHIEVVNQRVPQGSPPSTIERWTRVYTPTDPVIARKIVDQHNQKERAAYRFTLYQMVKLEVEMDRLVADLSAFNAEVDQISGPIVMSDPSPK